MIPGLFSTTNRNGKVDDQTKTICPILQKLSNTFLSVDSNCQININTTRHSEHTDVDFLQSRTT